MPIPQGQKIMYVKAFYQKSSLQFLFQFKNRQYIMSYEEYNHSAFQLKLTTESSSLVVSHMILKTFILVYYNKYTKFA